MSTEDDPPYDFAPLESAIQTAQDVLSATDVPDNYAEDKGDLENRLEELEDATDAGQDGDLDALGRTPAFIDYIQQLADNLSEQLDGGASDAMQQVETSFEDVEEHIERYEVNQTLWYLRVKSIPLLSEGPTPKANDIIEKIREDDPGKFTLKAKASEFGEVKGEFTGNQQLPLNDYFIYDVERTDGGGRA